MDTSDLASNDVRLVVVSGVGPALPDLITKPTGSVTGVIRAEGSPLADAQVEICVEGFNQFSGFAGETPCSGQPAFYQTTTDAEGRFRFDKVPTGHYAMVIGANESWTYLSTFGVSSKMFVEPEQELDLGELVINPA